MPRATEAIQSGENCRLASMRQRVEQGRRRPFVRARFARLASDCVNRNGANGTSTLKSRVGPPCSDRRAPSRSRSGDRHMKKWMLSVALATMTAVAWALPSLQEVEAQVAQGHYTQAESMMKDVVAAKPNSARAHYVYAEILAHDGNVSRAAEEARLARQIDPDHQVHRTPEKFRVVRDLAAACAVAGAAHVGSRRRPRGRAVSVSPAAIAPAAIAPAAVAPVAASSGLPSWIWLVGLAVVAFFLWRGFSRSQCGQLPARWRRPARRSPTAARSRPNAMMQPGAMPYGRRLPGDNGQGVRHDGRRPRPSAGGVAAGMLADRADASRPRRQRRPTTTVSAPSPASSTRRRRRQRSRRPADRLRHRRLRLGFRLESTPVAAATAAAAGTDAAV